MLPTEMEGRFTMWHRPILSCAVCFLAMAGTAHAQSHTHSFGHSGHGGQVGGWHPHAGPQPFPNSHAGGGRFGYRPPTSIGWSAPGLFPFAPSFIVVAPGGFFPPPLMIPPPVFVADPRGFTPAGPQLPPDVIARGLAAIPGNRPADPGRAPGQPPGERGRAPDAGRSNQLVTLGDRLFRNGNLHRSADRYEQAMNANPNAATPRVRLAQIALVRGNYAEAANRFREAQAAEPEWLLNAPDIQAIYAEPGDFAAPIAKLETHLQVHPNDRDGWLVLGAQWYLSGRTRQAADVFRRLTDRAIDPTLTAFLDATATQTPARR
jgi:hypothetical protein